MNNKETAFNECVKALENVVEYRGLHYNIYKLFRFNRNTTIDDIKGYTEELKRMLKKPLYRATEKQLYKLTDIAKRFEEDIRVKQSELNTHQATKLYKLYVKLERNIEISNWKKMREIQNEIDFIYSHAE